MSANHITANAGQSRRRLLVGSLAVAASAGAAAATQAGNTAAMKSSHPAGHRTNMVTTQDGTQIYYKDWGTGPNTVVFSHGWPLSADAWEDQMMFLASNGYRCIAHDRRGHGPFQPALGWQQLRHLCRRPQYVGNDTGPQKRHLRRPLHGGR